jgi:2-hydroxy-6-oxonona-2,4-dienedioate hydrolase
MLWSLVAAIGVAGLVVALAYSQAMERAYERLRGRSQLLASPLGDIEYSVRGSGPAVLVVHGSGGGFDQGEFLGEAALGDRFRQITPSRFGYLRSTFRPGATFDEQAEAYARLLDHLGLQKVAVLAFSHGGPSALLFAARHPERVSSLTLLSAGVASSSAPDQQQANQQGDALVAIFRHDFLYWAITQAFRQRFLALMGVDAAVSAGLGEPQQRLAAGLIDVMNPVAPRAAGAAFDNRAQMPGERIAAIRAPTLIVHARDDRLQLFHNAEFAASRIAAARLLAFERGGHLLLAVEQGAIRDAVLQHILAHADEPPPLGR